MKYKATLQERWFTEDRITFNERQLLDNINNCGDSESDIAAKLLFTELLNTLRFKIAGGE